MARLPLGLGERAARLSIRARLLLLVLALGLPFLAYIAIEAAYEARADRELAKERSLAVARVVAARLDDYVGDINQLLATLSHVVAIGSEHGSENDALLREMERDLPSYINNVAVWSLSGANVGSLNPQIRVKSASVADRHYFKDALSSKKLSLEAPIVARTNGELVAIFARPVMHADSVLGVVSASTQLKHLQGFLDHEGNLPKNSVITVIDPRGVVLARSAETDKWLGKNVSDQEAIRTSLLQGEGVAESAGVDTVARLYGYTTARSVPWLVYVGIPHESALAPVWLNLYRNLKLGGTLLLIAVIVAIWIAEKISAPMHQLASDAAALGSGDLGHRSSVATGGEAALLAQTLNNMAQSLQQRSHALEQSEQRLRLIADQLVQDLTQRKTLEDQLSHMAQYDQLTGLPNRYLLHDRLQLACQRSVREDKQLAVLYLDVDDFKSINDALGHAAGDALLKQFGQRLTGQVRASDTVARVGGDEFVVLIEGFFSFDDLRNVASKIVEAMQPPFDLLGRAVHVSASIGVATSLPSSTWEEILHAADSAMYQAKAAGSGRFVINVSDHGAGLSAANH
jgi:diguanylate cyclase (GGDEF)-like protein